MHATSRLIIYVDRNATAKVLP